MGRFRGCRFEQSSSVSYSIYRFLSFFTIVVLSIIIYFYKGISGG